jgi:hypothetical protein
MMFAPPFGRRTGTGTGTSLLRFFEDVILSQFVGPVPCEAEEPHVQPQAEDADRCDGRDRCTISADGDGRIVRHRPLKETLRGPRRKRVDGRGREREGLEGVNGGHRSLERRVGEWGVRSGE